MITFREWQKINESYDQSLGVKSAQSVVNPNLSAFYDILEAKKKAMKKKMELDSSEESEEKPLDSTGDGETVKPKSEKDLPKKDDEKDDMDSAEDEESSDDELRDKMDDEDSDESDDSSDKKLFMKKKMKKDEKCDDKKEKKEEKDKKDEKCDNKKVKKEDVEFLQSLSKMMELPKSYNYENLEELPKIDPITGYVIK